MVAISNNAGVIGSSVRPASAQGQADDARADVARSASEPNPGPDLMQWMAAHPVAASGIGGSVVGGTAFGLTAVFASPKGKIDWAMTGLGVLLGVAMIGGTAAAWASVTQPAKPT